MLVTDKRRLTEKQCRTVLVVEDDADVRETLRQVVEDEGFSVAEAENGRAALEWLRTAEPPCVILLDLMMPIMDGWQFLTQIEQDGSLPQAPIVIVSATPQDRIEQTAAAHPRVAGYLQKPLRLEDVLGAVGKYCG
jgi:CheY-like chemotaxis protein